MQGAFAAQSILVITVFQEIEPILQTITNNFVTERNSGEAMAVG